MLSGAIRAAMLGSGQVAFREHWKAGSCPRCSRHYHSDDPSTKAVYVGNSAFRNCTRHKRIFDLESIGGYSIEEQEAAETSTSPPGRSCSRGPCRPDVGQIHRARVDDTHYIHYASGMEFMESRRVDGPSPLGTASPPPPPPPPPSPPCAQRLEGHSTVPTCREKPGARCQSAGRPRQSPTSLFPERASRTSFHTHQVSDRRR